MNMNPTQDDANPAGVESALTDYIIPHQDISNPMNLIDFQDKKLLLFCGSESVQDESFMRKSAASSENVPLYLRRQTGN